LPPLQSVAQIHLFDDAACTLRVCFRSGVERGVGGGRIGRETSSAENSFHIMRFDADRNCGAIPFFENLFHIPKNNFQAIENQRIN
jgi:hypothetical protein